MNRQFVLALCVCTPLGCTDSEGRTAPDDTSVSIVDAQSEMPDTEVDGAEADIPDVESDTLTRVFDTSPPAELPPTTPDTEVESETGPETETNCSDGDDEDNDGDTDCEDSDCSPTLFCQENRDCPECPSGTSCVDGARCLYPEGQTVEDYEPSERWSVITALRIGDQIPAGEDFTEAQVARGAAGAVCCFDFNADGAVDNGLAALLPTIEIFTGDLGEILTQQIEGTSSMRLAEYKRGFNGRSPSQLHFFVGTNDIDGNGEADQERADIEAGAGVFLLSAASLGDRGARVQFNRGEYYRTSGEYLSPAEQVPFTLVLGELFEGLTSGISLTLEQARIEGTFEVDTPTTSVNREVAGEAIGGVRLGGIIRLDEFFGVLDDTVQSECTCAIGASSGRPARLIYGEGAGPRLDRWGYTCSDDDFDLSACGTEILLCNNINLLCGTNAQFLSSSIRADIDTNGSGIEDAISAGVFLTMANATIADGVFAGVGDGSGSKGSGE